MSRSVIWLAGPPGSGKTTAGRRAARTLGLEFVSAGERFRAEAERRGLSLAEFSQFAESHPEVDRALDEGMIKGARPGVILEGRIVGALLRRAGTPVFAVRLEAREEVRAVRIAGRDGTDLASALAQIRARSESERRRYAAYYGIDLDREPFDRRLDTSDLDAEASARQLAELLGSPTAGP